MAAATAVLQVPQAQYVESPVGQERYELTRCLVKKWCGSLYFAKDRETDCLVTVQTVNLVMEGDVPRVVAAEEVPAAAETEFRQHRALDHPNILRLLDVHVVQGMQRVLVVFEPFDIDARSYCRAHGRLPRARLMSVLAQTTAAVEFCHQHGILHQDLTPDILCFNLATGQVKVSGFLDTWDTVDRSWKETCLWYRSPEIMLGPPRCGYTGQAQRGQPHGYGRPADVWSLGCIAGELGLGWALFRGDSEIDMLFKIFQTLGTPTEASWPGVTELLHYSKRWPQWKDSCFAKLRAIRGAELGDAWVDFLSCALRLDPARRHSAARLRRHHFFPDPVPEVRAVASAFWGGSVSLAQARQSNGAARLALAAVLAGFADIRWP